MEVVFDFDGVIAKQEEWRGHDAIGAPIPQTIEVIKKLHKDGHKITLHTTRLNPQPFGPSGMLDPVVQAGDAEVILRQWLQEQGILDCFDHIAKHKPYGDVYVDDKGVRFLDHMDAYELYTYILLHVPPQKRVASVTHTPNSKENGNETRNENETGKRKPKK